MGRIIFIIGATKSGKSAFAVETAKKIDAKRVAFVATCMPEDGEMKARIAFHKKVRPSAWKTIEAGRDLVKELKGMSPRFKVVIVDCLTLFVSGLIMRGLRIGAIKKQAEALARSASGASRTTIIVSNEVGAGVVPENRMARDFRDSAGLANQVMAKTADEVYLVAAGIPIKIKG